MVIINTIYLIVLIVSDTEKSLNPLELNLYDNVFSGKIDKRKFKKLLNETAEPLFFQDKVFIEKQASPFKGVYLVSKLKPYYSIIYLKDEKEISRNNECFQLGLRQMSQIFHLCKKFYWHEDKLSFL